MPPDILRGTKCDRLNSQGWIETGIGHQNASVHDKQIVQVVALTVGIDDRCFGVTPHSAGTILVVVDPSARGSAAPGFNGPSFLQQQLL